MELNGLKTKFLGRNMMFFKSIDSTQIKVKSLKQPNNGTIIIADNQIAGVGTRDRKWYTGAGKNIAMSFVLIPDCKINKIENLTTCIAECVKDVLNRICQKKFRIKIPNDIYYNEKKVAGILTETVCKSEYVKKIYIGIGMNVNQDYFPGNLSDIATSLKIECNKEFDREEIIVEFLNKFEKEYIRLLEG